MDLVHQPLQTLLEGTGHRSPDLGGSTASILAALIGLSLIRMAVEVSLGRQAGGNLDQALARLDQQSVALADLADADRDAFQAYLDALKRRREPPQGATGGPLAAAAIDGARAREDAVTGAETLATQTPVEAAHVIVEALELVVATAGRITATVASDVFGGAAVLYGALTGVLLAVDINLRSGQPQSRNALSGERDDLFRRGKAAFAEIAKRADAAGYQL